MSNKILVTDSLFIASEHVKKLENAGYEVERLDKPEASEEELCEAVKGKIGYILGGIEKVTDKVLKSADELKAIVFTGIDYKNFIPASDTAIKKGIAIANVPDGPTQAVAEWAIGATLLMNRNFTSLGRSGDKTFMTTKGIEGQNIGIVGFGRIGKRLAKMLQQFSPATIKYWSPHTRDENLGATFTELDDLLTASDIIYVAVPAAAKGLLNSEKIYKIKDNALLVTFTHGAVIDEKALLERLQKGSLQAVSDDPIKTKEFDNLPMDVWYCFNGSNAFNTESGIKLTSDTAIESMLNLLAGKKDKYQVS